MMMECATGSGSNLGPMRAWSLADLYPSRIQRGAGLDRAAATRLRDGQERYQGKLVGHGGRRCGVGRRRSPPMRR